MASGLVTAVTITTAADSLPPALVVATAAPPAAVPTAEPVAVPTTTSTPTSAPTTTKSKPKGKTSAECNRIAMRSDVSNAELRPYLRSLGCDAAADGLLVGAGTDEPEGGPGFDPDEPSCQGSVDLGTFAGRGQASGESQYEYGCQQGYITEGC